MTSQRCLHPHRERDAVMRRAYGFGLFPLPRYRDMRHGDWRIARYPAALVDGYTSGVVAEPYRHVLHHRGTAWMSTSLFELESQAWHVAQAAGTVVVAGLGLGLFVHAALAKPDVDRLVVVERAGGLLPLLEASADLAQWQGRRKLAVVETDAFSPDLAQQVAAATGGRPIDYLYADLWPSCPAPAAAVQTAQLVRALKPRRAGWWSQELSLALWCRSQGLAADAATASRYFEQARVPVAIDDRYAAFCTAVLAAHAPPRRPGLLKRLWSALRGPSDGARVPPPGATAARR